MRRFWMMLVLAVGLPSWPLAWARTARVASLGNTTIGYLDDHLVSNTDFHFVACSGARARDLLPSPRPGQTNPPTDAWGNTGGTSFRELSQVDSSLNQMGGLMDSALASATATVNANGGRVTRMGL